MYREEETTSTREKETQDDELKKVEIKNKEKTYLDGVFSYLCSLEQEPSSDEDSKEKKYKKAIEEKVKEKKMKIQNNHFKSKTLQSKSPKKKKKFKEDQEGGDLYQDPQDEEAKLKKGKFGIKALRKVLRKLTNTYNKDEIKLMIWEVDSNLDGFVSFDEYEKMYKRCVLDQKEREPKKLYYLVQFLMLNSRRCKTYLTRNTNGCLQRCENISVRSRACWSKNTEGFRSDTRNMMAVIWDIMPSGSSASSLP